MRLFSIFEDSIPEDLKPQIEKYAKKLNIDPGQLRSSLKKIAPGRIVYWVLSQIKRNRIRLPEDENRVKKVLNQFEEYKNALENKDLFSWNINDLEDALDSLTGEDIISRRQNIIRIKKEGAKEVLENKKYKIIRILSPEAAVQYAKHTKWCTSDIKMAKNYMENNNGLYLILKKRPDGKYEKIAQMTGDLSQINDVKDRSVLNKPELTPIITAFTNKLKKPNTYVGWIQYMFNSGHVINNLDQHILKTISRSPDAVENALYNYNIPNKIKTDLFEIIRTYHPRNYLVAYQNLPEIIKNKVKLDKRAVAYASRYGNPVYTLITHGLNEKTRPLLTKVFSEERFIKSAFRNNLAAKLGFIDVKSYKKFYQPGLGLIINNQDLLSSFTNHRGIFDEFIQYMDEENKYRYFNRKINSANSDVREIERHIREVQSKHVQSKHLSHSKRAKKTLATLIQELDKAKAKQRKQEAQNLRYLTAMVNDLDHSKLEWWDNETILELISGASYESEIDIIEDFDRATINKIYKLAIPTDDRSLSADSALIQIALQHKGFIDDTLIREAVSKVSRDTREGASILDSFRDYLTPESRSNIELVSAYKTAYDMGTWEPEVNDEFLEYILKHHINIPLNSKDAIRMLQLAIKSADYDKIEVGMGVIIGSDRYKDQDYNNADKLNELLFSTLPMVEDDLYDDIFPAIKWAIKNRPYKEVEKTLEGKSSFNATLTSLIAEYVLKNEDQASENMVKWAALFFRGNSTYKIGSLPPEKRPKQKEKQPKPDPGKRWQTRDQIKADTAFETDRIIPKGFRTEVLRKIVENSLSQVINPKSHYYPHLVQLILRKYEGYYTGYSGGVTINQHISSYLKDMAYEAYTEELRKNPETEREYRRLPDWQRNKQMATFERTMFDRIRPIINKLLNLPKDFILLLSKIDTMPETTDEERANKRLYEYMAIKALNTTRTDRFNQVFEKIASKYLNKNLSPDEIERHIQQERDDVYLENIRNVIRSKRILLW